LNNDVLGLSTLDSRLRGNDNAIGVKLRGNDNAIGDKLRGNDKIMKVLHIISGTLKGGAARGGAWLHLGLCEAGIDSRILATRTDADYPQVSSVLSKGPLGEFMFYYHIGSELVHHLGYPRHKKRIFSNGFLGYSAIERHPWFVDADIIHLHWINWGMVSPEQVRRFPKPVVWTMRDMWAMTGGCHYAMECRAYQETCGRCPVLGSHKANDLTTSNQRRKIMAFSQRKIHWVAISPWLAECARQSTILKDQPVRVIPNGVDTEIFFPVPKAEARRRLGWNQHEKVILTGAIHLNLFWKGTEEFFRAYRTYLATSALALFGDARNLPPEYRSLVRYDLGHINDFEILRLVYSAADVFVAPSIQEAFGKTLIESMACGTPVVCFNATGPKTIVDHKVNGYQARAYDVKDLAQGIEWVLNFPSQDRLAAAARQKVEQAFTIKSAAREYIDLYQKILKNENSHHP